MPRSIELWTPSTQNGMFTILVDKPFAIACIGLNDIDRKHFKEAVWKKAIHNRGEMPPNYLELYGGILPREVHPYLGTRVWLEVDGATCELHTKDQVKYESKNRGLPYELGHLMHNFTAWASVAAETLEWF